MRALRVTLLLGVAIAASGQGTREKAASIQNLALGKPTRQSSTYNFPNVDSSKGVDGIKDRGIFHTALENNPWWEVDLGAPYQLDHIMLYNRTDCCGERAIHVRVLVSEDEKQWLPTYAHDGTGFRSLRVGATGKVARYVRVELPERNYLHLAEVEVWGAPLRAAPQPVSAGQPPPAGASAQTPTAGKTATAQTAGQVGAQTQKGSTGGQVPSASTSAGRAPVGATSTSQPQGVPTGGETMSASTSTGRTSGSTPPAGQPPAGNPPKAQAPPTAPPKPAGQTQTAKTPLSVSWTADSIWRVSAGMRGVGRATGARLSNSGELPVPDTGTIYLAFNTGVRGDDPNHIGYGSLEVFSGKRSYRTAQEFLEANRDPLGRITLSAVTDSTYRGMKAITYVNYKQPTEAGLWEEGIWCLADPDKQIWIGFDWSIEGPGPGGKGKLLAYKRKLDELMESIRINGAVQGRR